MLFFSVLFFCLLIFHIVSGQKVGGTALEVGQLLELECIQRDEDGEVRSLQITTKLTTQAVEDTKKQRIFTPFLICNETGSPPTFNFRRSTSRTRTSCTVTIDDPTFHLFQAYLHLDIPLICRLPSYQSENGYWIQIPINLIGKAELSHFDIEPKINFIIHYDRTKGRITGGVAYSQGPTVTSETEETDLGWHRIKIGDEIQFEFSVRYDLQPTNISILMGRWISTEEVANEHTHRGSNALLIMAYPFLGGVLFWVLCRVLYDVLWSRQRIASVRQQTRFETAGAGMNMGIWKSKSARDMA